LLFHFVQEPPFKDVIGDDVEDYSDGNAAYERVAYVNVYHESSYKRGEDAESDPHHIDNIQNFHFHPLQIIYSL